MGQMSEILYILFSLIVYQRPWLVEIHKMEQKLEYVEFNIQDIWPIALVFVVTGIGVAFGLDVMTDVGAEFEADSSAANATDSAVEGTAKLVEKLPLIATVVVAAILIMILVRYLGRAA